MEPGDCLGEELALGVAHSRCDLSADDNWCGADRQERIGGCLRVFIYLHFLLSPDPFYLVVPGGIADLYLQRKGKRTMALEVAVCSGP